MLTRRLFALLAFVLCTTARADETVATVTSPDKQLVVTLQLTGEGRLAYRVDRAGKPLVNASRLGLLLTNAHQLDGGFKLVGQQTTEHDETWEQPWGESRRVRSHYRELMVELSQPGQGGRSMGLRFRVFNDGFGFRYELPEQAQLPITRISDELTEFDIAEPATAWWIPAGEALVLEYPVQRTPLAEVGLANTPLTMRTRSGLHLALHEAALVDYASMWVRKVGGQKLRAQLAPSASGATVFKQGAFATPWRTLRVADSAAALYESNLELNLNEPNKLGDVSWFQPGKFVGVWWEMHLNRSTWGSGPIHGANTANVERYMDFAAKYGFDGVLAEGWNLGWDGDWIANGDKFSFTKAYPDFDIKAITEYGRKKGVKLIGHNETGGGVPNYEAQLEDAMKLYESVGVSQVKTGYVHHAGDIIDQNGEKQWFAGQYMVRHNLHVAEVAAAHHIAIDAHEPVKDTGLRRTWPNMIAREGARGQEYNAWGDPTNPPEHVTIIPFTRMLSGPMDFTPGIFDVAHGKTDVTKRAQSTIANQLALYVVLYSPIQMAADLLENYEARPDAFQFIRDVVTDWETSKTLQARIGDYVVVARQARGGKDWFLGAVTDEEARKLTQKLDFLAPGKRYEAQIYRDGPWADYRSNPGAVTTEKKIVTSKDSLDLDMAPGGGTAIRFKALD